MSGVTGDRVHPTAGSAASDLQVHQYLPTQTRAGEMKEEIYFFSYL